MTQSTETPKKRKRKAFIEFLIENLANGDTALTRRVLSRVEKRVLRREAK